MAQSTGLECTSAVIKAFKEFGYDSKCNLIKDACSEQSSFVNFFNLYYCTLNENTILFSLFAIIFIFIAFYCLSTTAEEYLEPALTSIAEKLKLSESLSGVTLVAFANGAPDVFAAFAAGSLPDEGLLVPLGGLLGAGIFAISFVLSICIIFSKKSTIQAEKWGFNRDCLFYFCSLIYLVFLGLHGKITVIGVFGFLLMYAFFLAMALYKEAQIKRSSENKALQNEFGYETEIVRMLEDEQDFNFEQTLDELVHEEYIHIKDLTECTSSVNSIQRNEATSPQKLKNKLETYYSHSSFSKLQWQYFAMKRRIRNEYKLSQSKSLITKSFKVILTLSKIVAGLTIPANTNEEWSKIRAFVQPVTISLFIFWQLGLLDVLNNLHYLSLYVASVAILSLLIWKTTHISQRPQGKLGFFYSVLSFATSAIWINLIAHTIVDFISLISIFTGLPFNYLGLTLLAWGNSLPDMCVDLALMKKGMDQTALSGIFGGQFFNFTIGFGASLIRQVWAFGTKDFKLFENTKSSHINFVLIVWLLFLLIGIFIYGNKNAHQFNRCSAFCLLVLYFIFIVNVSYLTI